MRSSSRHASRLAFGLVLIAGMVRLVVAVGFEDHHHGTHAAADAIVTAWLAAFVAAAVVRWLLPVRRHDGLLHASFVVQAIGCALILPLTVQLLFFAAVGSDLGAQFDDWVAVSLGITAVAHLVFAALAGLRASHLARGASPIPVSTIYIWTVVAGSAPFPIIPSLFVALTGIPIVPLLVAMKPLADRERARVEVPLAIARGA